MKNPISEKDPTSLLFDDMIQVLDQCRENIHMHLNTHLDANDLVNTFVLSNPGGSLANLHGWRQFENDFAGIADG